MCGGGSAEGRLLLFLEWFRCVWRECAHSRVCVWGAAKHKGAAVLSIADHVWRLVV